MEASFNFHYGTMGCGKSTYVLQMRHTLEREGFSPALIKPSKDTRDLGVVRSRIGIEHECLLVSGPEDLKMIDPLSTHIICDESQFLDDASILGLANMVDSAGMTVHCFGLRTDYTGRLFPASAALMALADHLVELPMIYKDGRKAIMHVRKVDGEPIFEGNPIFVGDIDDEYESVSRKEYFVRRSVKHL